MPKPYDAITKHLIDSHPADWLALVGVSGADIEALDVDLVDSDLSTVTSQADRVLRINSPEPSLQHLELETGHRGAELPERLLGYSVLLSRKYKLPVDSSVVLLRREADSPALTGRLQYRRRSGEAYLTFESTVIRIWQLPVESLLSGGIGTLPLANITEAQLPKVVQRMRERLDAEATTDSVEGEFWTTASILMGLRYPEALTFELLKGVRRMKESVTYQAILREGEARGRNEGRSEGRSEEALRMLRLAGERRLGEPTPSALEALEAIDSPEQLEALMTRLFEIETWEDLLSLA